MSKLLPRAALILICAALAACTSDDGPRRYEGGGRSGGGAPRRLPNVFISPAGEPFRAAEGAPYPVVDWFARADANHDGRLTQEELRRDGLAFFDKLDANHDGVIDGLELQDYEQITAPEILPRIEGLHAMEGMDSGLTFGDPNNTDNPPSGRHASANPRQPDPPRGIGVQGAAVYSLVNTPEPVAAADAQLDGRITRSEFAAALDRRFELLDKSGVGYLTLSSLPKTPIQTEILRRAQARKRDARHVGHRTEAPDSQ